MRGRGLTSPSYSISHFVSGNDLAGQLPAGESLRHITVKGKVFWLENGVIKGEMERYWGEDPAAKLLYPPGKNSKYSWLSTGQTYHLFKGKRTQKEAHISVQVVDRFGNLYTQDLK